MSTCKIHIKRQNIFILQCKLNITIN